MGVIAASVVERFEHWRRARLHARIRRVLAREAAASLGAGPDPVLEELESRLWAPQRAIAPKPLTAHRLLTLTLPAVAAAVLVYALLSAARGH